MLKQVNPSLWIRSSWNFEIRSYCVATARKNRLEYRFWCLVNVFDNLAPHNRLYGVGNVAFELRFFAFWAQNCLDFGLWGLGIRPRGGVVRWNELKTLGKAPYHRSKTSLKISDRLDEFSWRQLDLGKVGGGTWQVPPPHFRKDGSESFKSVAEGSRNGKN